MKAVTFPQVTGKNLQRNKYQLPQDFPAEYMVVLIAFYRHQQLDIDTWLPFVDQVENEYENLDYVELPVIYKMNFIGQFMLNEGMRAGIPDQKAREKTMTLYLDKSQFLNQLGIDSEEEIRVFLVKKNGQVLWQETGKFTGEKGVGLKEAVASEIPMESSQIVE